jgi:hypothetical protein
MWPTVQVICAQYFVPNLEWDGPNQEMREHLSRRANLRSIQIRHEEKLNPWSEKIETTLRHDKTFLIANV